MLQKIKTTLFILIVVLASVAPLAFVSGCDKDKYSETYGTYYFDMGICMPTSNAFENIYIRKQENGSYNNINGELKSEDFRIKVEKGKVTVHGSFSPVVAGTNVTFNVNAEDQVVYEKISYKERDGGSYYEIYSDGEDTGIKVGKTGTSAVFECGEETGFSYQLVYAP